MVCNDAVNNKKQNGMENLANLTDEMLVKLYAEGNNKAFDTLLERYEEKIFSYIFFVVRDQDVANDIFQETFMKAVVSDGSPTREMAGSDPCRFSANTFPISSSMRRNLSACAE